MRLTLTKAKELKHGDVLHHKQRENADGTPERWRVNGKVKRWKRDTNRIEVPLKRGLYDYGYLTNYMFTPGGICMAYELPS